MAVRIVLKRSSIYNKRPNPDLLEPGELALNTNALTPGLFFETENNEVVKVGPTAVGVDYPTLTPSLGETSYNPITNSLSIGTIDIETAERTWKEISSPYLGGTNGYVVFVAPEFPTSTDSLLNDGQSAPFQTINRAVLEIGKLSIVKSNESDQYQNNRYTIVVEPGVNPVYNGPGNPININSEETVESFNVNFDVSDEVTPLVLQQFNPINGGVLLPRGTSIQGVDLRKSVLSPTHVPTYVLPGKGSGTNQPISSILKWTGNSLVNSVTFKDKIQDVFVSSFSEYKESGSAVFHSIQSHGFGLNDKVFFEFAPGAQRTPLDTSTAAVLSGYYYTYPLSSDTFLLSYTRITAAEANFVERSQLPVNDQGIAYICQLSWDAYSHHRLRSIADASLTELNEFYTKIQKAFPTYFQGKIDQAEVINPGETEIVAPVRDGESLLSNDNRNGSPYATNCTTRSSLGMCGVEHDSALVTGFRSVMVSGFTAASIQNDPAAYEIYTTIFDEISQKSITKWYPLAVATWASLPPADRPTDPWMVPTAAQLAYLNTVAVINVRYFYSSLASAEGKTYGIPDINNDFRHFGFRCINGGYMQVDTSWTVGTAIGFWGMSGSKMSVTNSTSNFGSVAIRTEGFSGIGSLGGALPQDRGFTFAGIRMPMKLNPYTVDAFNVYSLGATVKSVVSDLATGIQTMTLGPGFRPITLMPFSLAPNSALWVVNANIEFRAFFIDDGNPTAIFLPNGDCQLRLRAVDSSIPDTSGVGIENWSAPFIRRFQDPRTVSEQAYSLILQNTEPGHRDPMTGNILRIQQTSSNNNQALAVRPGVQFDPGPSGGWGRVFQVTYSQTSTDGDAPQFNETLLNRPISSFYYTAISALDNSRPWLEADDKPHGAYVTFQNRNWYATCNDDWEGVYFANDKDIREELKLKPYDYNSPYANSFCIENQYLVESTYQGQFGGDVAKEVYPKETYFRGSPVIRSNYDFSDFYDQDNGTRNFGLLRHDVNTGITSQTTEVLTPTENYIVLASLAPFQALGDPKKDFIVLRLYNPLTPDRYEFVQVVGFDDFDSSVTVVRGVYKTPQTGDWPIGTTAIFQATANEVLPEDYDKDWAPSKYAMIRFLQVMGYNDRDIKSLLFPRVSSSRNIYVADISAQPSNGYALNTGPWGLEFNLPTAINCTSHQFHTVGYFSYSRGLPLYLKSNINTKQYYDFLSTAIWGGYLTLFGQNEDGQTVIEGDLTQAMTGRPYGSLSSDITNYPRIKLDTRDDGGETSYVRLIETGPGLVGGPITDVGSISLLPATNSTIGGVFPGDGLAVAPDGQLSLDRNSVGTVSSITAGIGLGAPATGNTITKQGTIDLLPPTATTIGGVTAGTGVDISISGVLGIKPATVGTIGGVTPGTGLSVSPQGALSLLPPSTDGTTIGGVKAGKGILIAPDGTISVPDGPSGIFLLDALVFDGVKTQFTLTSGGAPVVPAANQYTLIAVGGVIQSTPQAYSVTGSTITFTAPPPAGASFYGVVFG